MKVTTQPPIKNTAFWLCSKYKVAISGFEIPDVNLKDLNQRIAAIPGEKVFYPLSSVIFSNRGCKRKPDFFPKATFDRL